MNTPYVGSKRWLAPIVEKRLPLEAKTLISPFFGSGKLEYYIAIARPGIRVLGSDLDPNIVEMHRSYLQDYQAFREEALGYTGMSKETYHSLLASPSRSGAATYALLRSSFNGKIGCRHSPRRMDLLRPGPPNVEVRCADALDVVREATEDDFLYLDPPYGVAKRARHYSYCGDMAFQERLAESLKGCRAPWILSVDPVLRDLYADWCDIEEMSRVESFGHTPYTELLITPVEFKTRTSRGRPGSRPGGSASDPPRASARSRSAPSSRRP